MDQTPRPGSRLRRGITRRGLLAAVPGAMLLAAGVACSDSKSSNTPTALGTADAATKTGTAGASATTSSGWTFTDDRGKTVSLAQRPTRIVAQTSAAAALWDYGVRPIGIYGPGRLADGTADFQAGNIDLDAVTYLGDYGALDLELLASLKPEIYVDGALYGDQLWYAADNEARIAEIVPTIGISIQKVSIMDSIGRFEELSELLGADLNAPDVAAAKAAFAKAEEDLRAAIAEKAGLSVMACSPAVDQLYVASPEYMTDLNYFSTLGLEVIKPDVDDFFEPLSWEQAGKYPADLILMDERTAAGVADTLKKIGTWQSLPAVKAGQTGPWYAGSPYSHKRFAPIVQELAGIVGKSSPDLV